MGFEALVGRAEESYSERAIRGGVDPGWPRGAAASGEWWDQDRETSVGWGECGRTHVGDSRVERGEGSRQQDPVDDVTDL